MAKGVSNKTRGATASYPLLTPKTMAPTVEVPMKATKVKTRLIFFLRRQERQTSRAGFRECRVSPLAAAVSFDPAVLEACSC